MKIRLIISSVLVLTFTHTTRADLVTYDGDMKPLSITGLDIAEVGTYNVTFHWGKSFEELFGQGAVPSLREPAFWNDFSAATAAINAIQTTLNADGPVDLPGSSAYHALTPYTWFEEDVRLRAPYVILVDGSTSWGSYDFGQWNDDVVASDKAWTTYDAAAVPEPSSLLLMSLAVRVAGVCHRRKKLIRLRTRRTKRRIGRILKSTVLGRRRVTFVVRLTRWSPTSIHNQ